jgi:DMSO reductase anchor subunit
MNPALSVVFFTTLAGAAQGLVVALAIALLSGVVVSAIYQSAALLLAAGMLLAGLGASFAHLGHPERAWRAALMWRTSWLSREVIVLPAMIGLVLAWWLAVHFELGAPWQWLLPLLSILGSLLLWYCTAMIYACLPFIEEWAHPLTFVNYLLLGLASGLVLGCAVAAIIDEAPLLHAAGPWALGLTLLAWSTRALALRRNARLRHRSNLQTATGIHASKLAQKSMGMTGGSFNTREFFHGRTPTVVKQVKLALIVLGYAAPALLLLWGLASDLVLPWVLALVVQAPGVVADRWFFFAQARHPQNLYYQATW